MDLTKLSKEIQDIFIGAYETGYWDRDAKLAPYNNHVTNESKIEYLNAILNPETEECELEKISSVS